MTLDEAKKLLPPELMTNITKIINGREAMIVLKRISWRVQPVEQIRKRKQRRKDMWQRHEQSG